MQLVKNLGFAKEIETWEDEKPAKAEIISNVKAGLEEVELFKKGKLKTTPAKEFLNEL